jgi:hypothetical protein
MNYTRRIIMIYFTYDLEITKMVRYLSESVHSNYPDYSIDTRYMNLLNDICPKCERKLRVTGRRIEGVDAVGYYGDHEKKNMVFYCICKSCAKNISQKATVTSTFKKNNIQLDVGQGEFDYESEQYVRLQLEEFEGNS